MPSGSVSRGFVPWGWQRAGLLVLAASIAAAGSAAAQMLVVQGSTTAQVEAPMQDSFADTAATAPLQGSASASIVTGTTSQQCNASARADYGILRIALFGMATGGDDVFPSGSLVAGSTFASFEDQVTIVAPRPELSNTEGSASVRVMVSGQISANAGGALDSNAFADYFVTVRFGPTNCGSTDPDCADSRSGAVRDRGSLGGGTSSEGEPLPLSFETQPLGFFFDQPFPLGVELGSTLGADGDEEPLTAISSAELGNSLHWDGFVEVRDGSGELVTDYEITSATGIDWSLPVPESGHPALPALAALALLRVHHTARRRAS